MLDPFCGCGTAIAAAQKLNRQWIGIDITHLAVALMKNRLKTAFNIIPGPDYRVVGEPVDVGSARALAEQDRYQFEFWAMSLLEAFPREQKKKGADQGVDGVVYFIDGPRRAREQGHCPGQERQGLVAPDTRPGGHRGAGEGGDGAVHHP